MFKHHYQNIPHNYRTGELFIHARLPIFKGCFILSMDVYKFYISFIIQYTVHYRALAGISFPCICFQ